MSFENLGLGPEVLKAVEDAGYKQPTPIQEQAIPLVLMGRDVLGCAQTGTGKTASYTLPMIDILAAGRAKARMPRSLVLAPTRELAAQVAQSFATYGKHHKLNMALLIGGEAFGPQEAKLDRGVDVLIATPGRLIDHFERGKVLLNDVKILVIDEADRMLDMGFIPDVERIVSFLPKIRQTLFFSATFPPEVRRLADAFLMNPKQITVSPSTSTAETVQHALVKSPSKDYEKRETLRALIRSENVQNAVIFCNRKRDVDVLAKSLKRHGFSAEPMHGDMAQASRTETLAAFKAGEITLLVATDVAGRGLDVVGLSHVFNFDVPIHAEDYVHRIGRTGRAGREGRAFTLATRGDHKFVAAITKMIGKQIPYAEIPGAPAIDESAETEESSDRRGGRERRGGSRDRGRGGPRNERSRSRGEKRTSDESREQPQQDEQPIAAAPEPAQHHEAPAVSERREDKPREDKPREDKPRERNRERRARPERERTERDRPEREKPVRQDRDRNKERRDRGDRNDRDDRPVQSFGDHMPSFMQRPVRKVSEQA
jgi:superfamily II DNA/RNA helicase